MQFIVFISFRISSYFNGKVNQPMPFMLIFESKVPPKSFSFSLLGGTLLVRLVSLS